MKESCVGTGYTQGNISQPLRQGFWLTAPCLSNHNNIIAWCNVSMCVNFCDFTQMYVFYNLNL